MRAGDVIAAGLVFVGEQLAFAVPTFARGQRGPGLRLDADPHPPGAREPAAHGRSGGQSGVTTNERLRTGTCTKHDHARGRGRARARPSLARNAESGTDGNEARLSDGRERAAVHQQTGTGPGRLTNGNGNALAAPAGPPERSSRHGKCRVRERALSDPPSGRLAAGLWRERPAASRSLTRRFSMARTLDVPDPAPFPFPSVAIRAAFPFPSVAIPTSSRTASASMRTASRSSSSCWPRRSVPAAAGRTARPARSCQCLDRPEHRRGQRPLRSRGEGPLLPDRPRQRDGVPGGPLAAVRPIPGASRCPSPVRALLKRIVAMLTRLASAMQTAATRNGR